MDKHPVAISKTAALTLWRFYLILAILQGIVSISLLLQVGTDTGKAAGISTMRLGFALAAALLLMLFAWQVLVTWLKPTQFNTRFERLSSSLAQKPGRWVWAMLVSGFLAFLGLHFITLTPEITEPFTRAYFDRLLPLVIWLTGLATQTFIALSILRYGKNIFTQYPREKSFYLAVAGIGLLFLLWSWVAQKSSAEEAKITVWGAMGAPVLELQVLVAWLAGMGMLAWLVFLPSRAEKMKWLKKITPKRLDLFVGLLLWITSIWIWQSVPLTPNWFVTDPRAPNHEYYPNSDAQYYDITAQSALVGEGFLYFDQKTYVRRPMLALLTVVLHALGGQDYETEVFLQIFVLAWITPLAYFLTRLIHNRISGIIAAVLIMLREANSIALTSRITTSNAKLLMADVPAMLAVLALALMISLWFKTAAQQNSAGQKPRLRETILYALFSGGILGIGMLVRPEIILFSAVVGLISALIYLPRKHFAVWVKSMLVFSLGLGLVLAPWIWRNWRMTGQIVLDSPIMRLELIVLRYRSAETPQPSQPQAPTPDSGTQPSPPPTIATPVQPAATSTPVEQNNGTPVAALTPEPTQSAPRFSFSYAEFVQYFQEETTNYIRQHPEQILRFVTSHFTHSYIQSILILPTTFRGIDSLTAFSGHRSPETLWQDCCSTLKYIRRLPYWRKWDGSFPSQSILFLIINCLLIATGISEAWKRQRWVGITPLLMSGAFFLLHAIFRNSGGRYILPTDWVSIFYFSIGLSRVSLAIFHSLSERAHSEQRTVDDWDAVAFTAVEPELLNPQPARLPALLFTVIGLFAIGCSLPVVELSIPKRYTEAKATNMLEALYQSSLLDESQRNGLLGFVESGGLIYPGRALYPTFYLNDAFDPGSRQIFQQPFSRLAFYLVGPTSKALVLPLSKSPAYFPNASDVLVFLCPDWKVLAAAAFDPAGQPAVFLPRSDLVDLTASWICPLPELPPE